MSLVSTLSASASSLGSSEVGMSVLTDLPTSSMSCGRLAMIAWTLICSLSESEHALLAPSAVEVAAAARWRERAYWSASPPVMCCGPAGM